MKLSISVPDDLWAAVYRGGDSPSSLVQRALQLLATDFRKAERPFPHAPAGLDTTKFDEGLRKLTDEANDLARAGYEIGIEVAALLPWSKIERLADIDEVADWLLEENAINDLDRENSSPFLLEVWSRMGQHPLAAMFDLERSPTARRGVAYGLIDMRGAVLREVVARHNADATGLRSITEKPDDMGIRKGDVPDDLLAMVVGLLPDTFRTKDVSDHSEMTATLARFAGQPQYHAIVGRRLSKASEFLGLNEIAKGGSRGSTWRKRSSPASPDRTASAGAGRSAAPPHRATTSDSSSR